jgi:peptidyl-prolyl cis-trans isomerase C
MNFKQKFFLAITASALIVTAMGTAAQEEASEQQGGSATSAAMADDVMATVNGEEINRIQFAAYLQSRIKGQPNIQVTPQLQGAAFNDMLKVYALAQEAEKKGLDKKPDVQDALLVKRKELLAQVAMLDFLDKHPVDEKELKELYDERVGSEKKTEYKARHILVESEDDAKQVIVELDEGADFAELAKSRSTGPSGPNGGDLGWFQRNQMVEPFGNSVAEMDNGSYSKEPVKTQFGWHVILLEDTREVDPPSFEQMRPQLENELKQKALREYVVSVQKAADVKVNEALAKAAAETPAASQPADDQGEE